MKSPKMGEQKLEVLCQINGFIRKQIIIWEKESLRIFNFPFMQNKMQPK